MHSDMIRAQDWYDKSEIACSAIICSKVKLQFSNIFLQLVSMENPFDRSADRGKKENLKQLIKQTNAKTLQPSRFSCLKFLSRRNC